MAPSSVAQFKMIFAHGIRVDLKDRERLLSPLLLAATLVVLFAFATGELVDESRFKIFAAEVLLIIMFTLQGVYLRLFDPESEDGAVLLLESYPVSFKAYFVAKFCLCVLFSIVILVPTILLTGLFHQIDPGPAMGLGFLVVLSLSSLGVLLSALTLKASGRETLFPILYFLLASPVLLGAVQALAKSAGGTADPVQHWYALLVGCAVIYFTLGLVLFEELFARSK